MKINFEFEGHSVEMDYTYNKGVQAPLAVNERTFLTPPDRGEFEVHSLKIDGVEKEVNKDIDEEYLLEEAEQAERDAELAMEDIIFESMREDR